MEESQINSEAEWLLATMDGLEIQFLLNPSMDLEASFGAFLCGSLPGCHRTGCLRRGSGEACRTSQ
jgi:hypothetical protein